jgi:hypothetical protein
MDRYELKEHLVILDRCAPVVNLGWSRVGCGSVKSEGDLYYVNSVIELQEAEPVCQQLVEFSHICM